MLVEVPAGPGAAAEAGEGGGGKGRSVFGDGGWRGGTGGGVLVLRPGDVLHVGAGRHGQAPRREDLQCQQVSQSVMRITNVKVMFYRYIAPPPSADN